MSRFRLTLAVDADRDPVDLGTYESPEEAMEAAREDPTRVEEWGEEVRSLPEGEWELYQRRPGEPRSWTKWIRPDGPPTEAYYTVKESWKESSEESSEE